jgi:hypothetical protein
MWQNASIFMSSLSRFVVSVVVVAHSDTGKAVTVFDSIDGGEADDADGAYEDDYCVKLFDGKRSAETLDQSADTQDSDDLLGDDASCDRTPYANA